jgi:hypothetical protein
MPRRQPVTPREATRRWSLRERTSAAYLDQLGRESARAYAFVLSAQASHEGIPLPLPDDEVNRHLDVTIAELERQGRLPWSSLSSERTSVFVNAWVDEMNKLGVRG